MNKKEERKKKSLPKITVITVVYNRVNTIEQTISSVVNQTYSNIEYIIIDGGSTDGTVDIIKKYEKQIDYWVSEPDGGIYDAMNKGARVATGDYVQFLNSDDCFCAYDIIGRVVQEIDNETDILSCQVCVVDEKTLEEKIIGQMHIDRANYRGGMVIPHPGMFTRRELLKKYPFDIKYKIKGDYKFFLSCFLDESVYFKFSSLRVVFFSDSGISNREDSVKEEIKINRELGKKYVTTEVKGRLIEIIQSIIGKSTYLELHDKTWRKNQEEKRPHSCENKICRWCGRKAE